MKLDRKTSFFIFYFQTTHFQPVFHLKTREKHQTNLNKLTCAFKAAKNWLKTKKSNQDNFFQAIIYLFFWQKEDKKSLPSNFYRRMEYFDTKLNILVVRIMTTKYSLCQKWSLIF
jgi:hypothetical protein